MDRYSRTDLADASVVHNLKSNDATNRGSLADLLADLGELDERKLWRDFAYPSLHEYCTQELNWSEDEAYKRVRVAQVARTYAAIFHAIADGRLNLSGVLFLKVHLTDESVEELIAAVARKTRRQIEKVLADRAPKPDLPTRIVPIDSAEVTMETASAATPSLILAPGAKIDHSHQTRAARGATRRAAHHARRGVLGPAATRAGPARGA